MRFSTPYIYLLALISFLVISCQTTSNNSDSNKSNSSFFDLPTYFQSEMDRLQSVKSVNKKVSVNGEQEEKEIVDWDASVDLQPFKDLSINKSAWADKYQVDTIKPDTLGVYFIKYTALDEKLQIRDVQVGFNTSGPNAILVNKKIETPIAETEQRLSYIAEQGFSITSQQSTLFKGDYDASVEVRWK